MKCNKLYINLLIMYLVYCNLLFSQSKIDYDSIIASGTLDVYENPDRSIKIGKSVYEDYSADVKAKVNGLMLISNGYLSKRDYQKSLEYIIIANQLSKRVNDPLMQIKTINKTAAIYQQLKIYDKAIQHLDEAEKLILLYPDKGYISFLMGNNHIVRGFIYREKLNCDIANSFFDKGITEYNKADNTNSKVNLSIVYYNKGNCYILLSDFDAAKTSFLKSLEMAKMVNTKSLEAFALKGLAEVYTIEGDYEAAIEELNKGLAFSESIGDLVLNQGIYKGLSENYLAINKWEDYQLFHKKDLEAQLKIKNSERNSVSESLNEISKEQDQRLKHTISRFNYGKIALFVVNILAVVLFIVHYKKCKIEIFQLKKDIENLQKIK